MKHWKYWLCICIGFICFTGTIHSEQIRQVYLGGDSIAVIQKLNGVLISGSYPFTYQKQTYDPFWNTFKSNDLIVTMDQQPVHDLDDYYRLLQLHQEDSFVIQVDILRGGKRMKRDLCVTRNAQSHTYQTGLYVKDELSGTGTMTYYDPSTHTFGALGHSMQDTAIQQTENGSNEPKGEVFFAAVTSILRSNKGVIGEKYATLTNHTVIGTIQTSNRYGVYGSYHTAVSNKKLMPVATVDEVQPGEAVMWTVIDGQTVQPFRVRILHAEHQTSVKEKGLIIEVIDPELLKEAGGIVQGMSGSPIVQNGKIVGALTHVMTSQPAKGYGIYLEWMLKQ